MVAGKNTTSHLAKAAAAPKLPPLPKLRVRKPDQTSANPCLGVMSSVLGMWPLKKNASNGVQKNAFENTACPSRVKSLTPTQVAGHLQVKQQQDAPTWKTRCEHAWIKG
jgi:hypothetical protein